MKTNIRLTLKSFLVYLVLLFAPAPATFAQGGIPLWTNRYTGPVSAGESPTAIAVDSSGNVFVTGTGSSAAGDGYVTVAYSGAGVPLWTNRYDGAAPATAAAIAVDSSGNVLIAGSSGLNFPNSDYATIKYSNSGVEMWTKIYNGPANFIDYAFAMAVDSSGNVLVTGQSYVSDANSDYATIKYSSAGVPMWTKRYNGSASFFSDAATAIAVDSDGNVIVTGSAGNGTGSDYTTIKYSSAGLPLWTKRYNGPGNGDDYPTAIAVDTGGNVFVTGTSAGLNGQTDYATIKYSSSGVPMWTNRYDGPANFYDYAAGMALDSNGNVFVTGRSPVNTTDPFNYDIVTIAYSSAGEALWTNRYDGNEDFARAIAVDSGGNVFVTGSSRDSNQKSYFVTIAYSNAGEPLWTNGYEGPVNYVADGATAIAVDRSGNVFVTGASYGGISGSDYLTIKYSSSLPPRLSIARDGSAGLFVRHNGVPDFTYRLQRAGSVTGPWSDLVTNTAPASGLIEYHELSPPPTQVFYRTMQP